MTELGPITNKNTRVELHGKNVREQNLHQGVPVDYTVENKAHTIFQDIQAQESSTCSLAIKDEDYFVDKTKYPKIGVNIRSAQSAIDKFTECCRLDYMLAFPDTTPSNEDIKAWLTDDNRLNQGEKPRLEMRTIPGSGEIVQIALLFGSSAQREAHAQHFIQEYGKSQSIVLGGATTLEVGTKGVDKATTINYVKREFDSLLKVMGYQAGPIINSRETKTAVISDADGTIWDAPQKGESPEARNLSNSPAQEGILTYLRAGGVLVVNSGNDPQRVINRFLVGIPEVERKELLSRVLVAAAGGHALLRVDTKDDFKVKEIADYRERGLALQHSKEPVPYGGFLYTGDDPRSSGNDYAAYQSMVREDGSKRFVCVPAKNSSKKPGPLVTEHTSAPGEASSMNEILKAIVEKASLAPHALFSPNGDTFVEGLDRNVEMMGYVDIAKATHESEQVLKTTMRILGRNMVDQVIISSDEQNRASSAQSRDILRLNAIREETFKTYVEKVKKEGQPISLTYHRLVEMTQTLQAAYNEQNLGEVAVLPQNVMREDGDWKLELKATLDKMNLHADPRVRILIPGNNDQGTSAFVAQQIKYIKTEYCGTEGKPKDVAIEVIIMGKGGHATTALYNQIGVMKPYATVNEQVQLLSLMQKGAAFETVFGEEKAKFFDTAINDGNIELTNGDQEIKVKNQFIGTPEAISFGQTLSAALKEFDILTEEVEGFNPIQLEGKQAYGSKVFLRLASESTNTGENVTEAVNTDFISLDDLYTSLISEEPSEAKTTQDKRVQQFITDYVDLQRIEDLTGQSVRILEDLKEAILIDRLYERLTKKTPVDRTTLESQFLSEYEKHPPNSSNPGFRELSLLKEQISRVEHLVIVSTNCQARRQWLTFCQQYSYERNNPMKEKLYGSLTSLPMPRGRGFVKSFSDKEAITEMYAILAEQCRSIQYAFNPNGTFIPAKADIKEDLEHIYIMYSKLREIPLEEAHNTPIQQITGFFGGEFAKLEKVIYQDLTSKGTNLVKRQQIAARITSHQQALNIDKKYLDIETDTENGNEQVFLKLYERAAGVESRKSYLERELRQPVQMEGSEVELRNQLAQLTQEKRALGKLLHLYSTKV
jgi:hypothetical protein